MRERQSAVMLNALRASRKTRCCASSARGALRAALCAIYAHARCAARANAPRRFHDVTRVRAVEPLPRDASRATVRTRCAKQHMRAARAMRVRFLQHSFDSSPV